MAQPHPLLLFREALNVTDGMDKDAQETTNAPHCQRRPPNISTLKPPWYGISTIIRMITNISKATTCTHYTKAGSTTVPAYCAPTFAFNLPAPPSVLGGTPETNVSVAPSIITVNKLDCCHACTRIFNCVWWNFEFGINTLSHPDYRDAISLLL